MQHIKQMAADYRVHFKQLESRTLKCYKELSLKDP